MENTLLNPQKKSSLDKLKDMADDFFLIGPYHLTPKEAKSFQDCLRIILSVDGYVQEPERTGYQFILTMVNIIVDINERREDRKSSL